MRNLLYNGDACVATGFAKVSHALLDVLRTPWDCSVVGINYFGDPHKYPYDVYPAASGGDSWGLNRIDALLPKLKPEVLVIQNDPWNVAEYVTRFGKKVPLVAYMPVDGKNCKDGARLNGLALGVFYTEFALAEARKGGYTGPAAVQGLGVDTDLYTPGSREAAREAIGMSQLRNGVPLIPEGAFIVGNINRNQPRKRLDLSIAYFAEWVTTRGITDAYLYLHLAPTGDKGWNVPQLASYYGVNDRVICTSKNLTVGVGVNEATLVKIYQSFDAMLSTTQGEGWGLCTMEGMACGIPQIVPDWSALGEWTEDAAVRVPCTSIAATVNNINIIGGIADREQTIAALDRMYRDRDHRADMSVRALALAQRPAFRWSAVGTGFAEALAEVFPVAELAQV